MAKVLVCDTNVFYNLASGKLKKADLKAGGGVVHYSPVSVIELIGYCNEKEFEQRRNAARAILESKATELLHPEAALASTFGYEPLKDDAFAAALKVFAAAQTWDDLNKGLVTDMRNRRVRVNLQAAEEWRATTEGDWLDSILRLMGNELSGFSGWYNPDPKQRVGNKPMLRGEQKKQYLKKFNTLRFETGLLLALHERSLKGAKNPKPLESNSSGAEKLRNAFDGIAAYMCVYGQYIKKLLTTAMLPQANDSEDLELFLYARDDTHIVVTAEKRWSALAKDAGFEDRHRKLEL